MTTMEQAQQALGSIEKTFGDRARRNNGFRELERALPVFAKLPGSQMSLQNFLSRSSYVKTYQFSAKRGLWHRESRKVQTFPTYALLDTSKRYYEGVACISVVDGNALFYDKDMETFIFYIKS